jgi:hypothetical protein
MSPRRTRDLAPIAETPTAEATAQSMSAKITARNDDTKRSPIASVDSERGGR